MVGPGYGKFKELESFEANNHKEARIKILNSINKNDCVFIKTESPSKKIRSYSMPTVYSQWP